jgi:hypothetical protein
MTKPNPGRTRNILARLRDDAEPTADDRASDLFDIERERMAEELPRSAPNHTHDHRPYIISLHLIDDHDEILTPGRPRAALYAFHDELHIPAGAEPDDDPEAFAAELVMLYAEAIERQRDRAQEARAGARYMRRHRVPVGPRDLAELVRRDRRDARLRLASSQEWPVGMGDAPIYRAGLAGRVTPAASAAQQTRSTRP